MKKVIMLLLLCGIANAEVCVYTPTVNPKDVPFPYDPNQTAYRIIDWAEIPYGVPVMWEFWGCDEDDDPFTITPLEIPLNATFDGRWMRWTPTKDEKGVHYISMRITDSPAEDGLVSGTSEASYVVNVKRMVNNKPQLNKIKR